MYVFMENWRKLSQNYHQILLLNFSVIISGLVVTCQPVHQIATEPINHQPMDTKESQGQPGSRKNSAELLGHPINGISSQLDKLSLDMDVKQVKFVKVGETCCSAYELSPMKVTLPTQDTVLFTGVPLDTQILIHKRKKMASQSAEEKYKPLELRVYASDDEFDVEQIQSVVLHDDRKGGTFLQDSGFDPQKSNCFTKMQEENTVPMKKRFVVDQNGGQNPSFSSNQCPSPPQLPPQFKRRIPDGWGYIPFDKRQRYGMLQTHEEVPLNLMKQ